MSCYCFAVDYFEEIVLCTYETLKWLDFCYLLNRTYERYVSTTQQFLILFPWASIQCKKIFLEEDLSLNILPLNSEIRYYTWRTRATWNDLHKVAFFETGCISPTLIHILRYLLRAGMSKFGSQLFRLMAFLRKCQLLVFTFLTTGKY